MADIQHRVGINAPREQVYAAISTVEGVSGWWTRTVDGDAAVGGRLRFFFHRPEPSAVMEIAEAVPGERVLWRCVEGPDEWVGTTISFELTTNDDETAVLFTHADWREPVAFMSHCSTKWAYFLLGLKASFEGGIATPYPDDNRISSWG